MGGPTFVKSFIPMREVVCAEIISSENGWIEENLTAPDDFGIGGEKWRDLRQGGEDWRPTRLSSVSVSTINRDTGHSDVRLHSGVDWWLWWREWWTLVTSFQDLIKYGGRGGGNLFPTTSAFPQGYLVTRSKILTRSGKVDEENFGRISCPRVGRKGKWDFTARLLQHLTLVKRLTHHHQPTTADSSVPSFLLLEIDINSLGNHTHQGDKFCYH